MRGPGRRIERRTRRRGGRLMPCATSEEEKTSRPSPGPSGQGLESGRSVARTAPVRPGPLMCEIPIGRKMLAEEDGRMGQDAQRIEKKPIHSQPRRPRRHAKCLASTLSQQRHLSDGIL